MRCFEFGVNNHFLITFMCTIRKKYSLFPQISNICRNIFLNFLATILKIFKFVTHCGLTVKNMIPRCARCYVFREVNLERIGRCCEIAVFWTSKYRNLTAIILLTATLP